MVPQRMLCRRIVTLCSPNHALLCSPNHALLHTSLRPVQTGPAAIPVAQRTRSTAQTRHRHRSTQINFDNVGSWNNRLDLPLNLEYSIKSGTVIPENSLDNVGSSSLLGRRKDNEDRYHLKELTSDTLMVSIFDGHGGSMAANFTWQHMAEHILHWLDSGVTDLQLVLREAFRELNGAFARYATQNYRGERVKKISTVASMLYPSSSSSLGSRSVPWLGEGLSMPPPS